MTEDNAPTTAISDRPSSMLPALRIELLDAQKAAAELRKEQFDRWTPIQKLILDKTAEFNRNNAELLQSLAEADARAASLEATLRSAVVEAYKDRLSVNPKAPKKLADGLSVQVRVTYIYRESDAVTWAKANAPYLLREAVNVEQFEAAMKAMGEKRPGFVKMEEKIVAAIGKEKQ